MLLVSGLWWSWRLNLGPQNLRNEKSFAKTIMLSSSPHCFFLNSTTPQSLMWTLWVYPSTLFPWPGHVTYLGLFSWKVGRKSLSYFTKFSSIYDLKIFHCGRSLGTLLGWGQYSWSPQTDTNTPLPTLYRISIGIFTCLLEASGLVEALIELILQGHLSQRFPLTKLSWGFLLLATWLLSHLAQMWELQEPRSLCQE